MDFFERQHVARKNTKWMIFYFMLAVFCMILVFYAVVMFGVGYGQSRYSPHEPLVTQWFHPLIFLSVAGGTISVIGAGSLYKVMELRAGGEYIAEMLGGRLVNPATTDPACRQLMNVVEEMALASGVPVPPVYVIEDDSINAFAAGYTASDAVIGVNRGTINFLNRDELQGVIAHEFSHILNGDMRLNIRLMGMLHGILMIAVLGYHVLHFSHGGRRDDNKGGAQAIMLLALAAVVLGYIGVFFGRLIKAAISRQREYLADASAVQFTRNPEGISGALQKIGTIGSSMSSPEAESASHMFFGSAFRSLDFVNLFATHPPLPERISRVDRNWDGTFPSMRQVEDDYERSIRRFAGPEARAEQRQAEQQAQQPQADITNVLGMPGGTMPGMEHLPFGQGAGKIPIDPMLVLAAIGSPAEEHREYSRDLITSLPDSLTAAIHDVFSARCVVFAMLLDPDETIRSQQGQLIASRDGDPSLQETMRLSKVVQQQPEEARLPIIEMIQGSLRGLSPEQYTHFRETVVELVKADQKISLFEFFLQRVLLGHLDRGFFSHVPAKPQYFAIDGVAKDVGVVLSTLVHVGHADQQEAEQVFGQAVASLQFRNSPAISSKEACSLKQLDESLEKLGLCAPPIKKRVLSASVLAIAADGEVTVNEAELLRTIADSLDCPMPPLAARRLTPSEA